MHASRLSTSVRCAVTKAVTPTNIAQCLPNTEFGWLGWSCIPQRPHDVLHQKTSPPGKKIHESFPLLKIGTGLTHRCETLSNSDQAPDLENETGPTGHRHEGLLVNTTCPSGTPRLADNENAGATGHCIDAPHDGARQRPPPSLGTACRDTAYLSEGTPLGPFFSDTQKSKENKNAV